MAEVAKLAGQKWKAMSAEAKKPYEKRAEEAKAAYAKAMEEFKAAGGEPGKRRNEKKEAKAAKAEKKAKKEARKNSGAPKRPPSGFWLWQVENRDNLVKEAGTKKIPVIGKLAGEKWKNLTAAQKTPFEKRAKEAKAEYEKALAEWKASNPTKAEEEQQDDDDDDEEEEEEDEEGEKEAESPPKKARKESANPSPKAKAKAKAKAGKVAGEAGEALDPAILKSAKDLGLEAQLRNLAQRDDIKSKAGISADAMLKALQSAGGLVNKAKATLLAGA